MNKIINMTSIFRKLTKIITILSNSFTIMLFFILLYFNFIHISNLFCPDKTADFLFFNFFEVASGSMSPGIKVKDRVILCKIRDKTKLQKGDIVYFENPNVNGENKRIIHRIIKNDRKRKTITTQGDANGSLHDYEIDMPYELIKAKHFLTIKDKHFVIFSKVISIFLFYQFLKYIYYLWLEKRN
ncbi:MAG: S26 family signal peptidase [Vigna little leaf phytoplasma]|nr:S26 family signal peptidase [Vigna little leaf phytoplasma]